MHTEYTSLLQLSWPAWLTLGVVCATFALLVCTRGSPDVVFLGGLGVLLLTGVLNTREALSGFSSSGLVTVGILYVVVAGLQETGGLQWITRHVLGHPKTYLRALGRMMIPVWGLSAFLNNTPVVALFIPVVTAWCRRVRLQPSRLLIPLSYASIFGGICTLIGTSTNLVVNGLVQSYFHSAGLHMFEITRLGLPCAVVGLLYVILARNLLPDRKTLAEIFENPREYTLELEVAPGSSLAGKTIEAGDLRHLPGGFLAELIRADQIVSAVPPDYMLQARDRLIFVGNVEVMRSLYTRQDLTAPPDMRFKLDAPRHQRCLVEAVVSNSCPIVGRSIREGHFRDHYNAVVMAMTRNGRRLGGKIGDVQLQPGDTLLVECHAGFISRQKDSRDFYLVSSVADSTPKRFEKAPLALVILLGMVLLAASGVLSMLEAAWLSAGLMIVSGCCSPAQARNSIEWSVLLTIGAALSLGHALDKTHGAEALAGVLLTFTRENPWYALAMVYWVTTLFTEIITNNAAAVLVFPIAMNTAERLVVNPMPFVMCIMIAASASFATPIGYQTNLMVYGPGGYRFTDYLRMGLPLNLLMGTVAVILAPLSWPF